jgi:2-methylcitrate dehydratase PrpD
MSNQRIAEALARWVVSFHVGAAPSDVVELAQLCVMDACALAVGAVGTEAGDSIDHALIGYSLPAGHGTIVVGHTARLSPGDSALVNGMLAHALQFDDGIRRAQGHPGASVVPASLAAGEVACGSGPELLSAVVAGYEVFARVGEALNPSHLRRGFHPSGTVGAVAAAAAAGRALRLEEAQLADAIGLAGSVAGGLMEYAPTGTMATYFVVGNAARVGVQSALLAAHGFTGPHSVIEGNKGMAAAMADEVDLSIATEINDFRIRETYFKPYPSCRHNHAAIEAALRITGTDGIDLQEISGVEVETYELAMDECDVPDYAATLAAADSSFQFAVATALRWGRFGLPQRTMEAVADPVTRKLAAQVRVVHNPAFDERLPRERPARVTVKLRNGTECSHEVALARGEPETPLTVAEMQSKAVDVASPVLGAEGADKLLQSVQNLPAAKDLHELCAALTGRMPG